MAIKERLLKQLDIVRDGLNAMPPFYSRDLNATRKALVQARDLCFQGLSEKHFAEYKDTYDGLLFAVDQLAADASDQGEIVSLCSELLQYTITQTQKETTFKKEIFFLPYKASMWDSLESVWKAADEDKEHCIAYVMPIPYADLTPEHTVAEWHCERDQFPNDVPTVKWEEFNLEEIHPDVIFIHNPYDEYNRVTSVESRHYSRNLKKCTDKLVYIPYFVLDEISPSNEAAEESISGFVLEPAILNADEVIVQSEDMRQVYINVLVRHTNQKDRAYWEKRVLGLGSPKIEKVLTSKKEDFELPEAWSKIIKGKKVILYNTSLSAMLQSSDKVCDKLRYVFGVFKNRKDVALWWRPHPLMKATIHSMRPEIEEEYCAIEWQYIKEGWGIYDDTGDLHRAIVWSNAYYGDGSSVIQLYRQTNKPIVLQIMDIVNQIPVCFWNVVVANDDVYFIEAYRNTIYKWNRRNEKIAKITQIPPDYLYNIIVSFGMICRIKHKILILPLNSKYIVEYDEITGQFSRSFTVNNLYQKDGCAMIIHCVAYENKRYFIGLRCSEIIKYDIENNEYKRLTKWFDLIKPYVTLDAESTPEYDLLPNFCLRENRLFLPFAQANIVIELDLNTDEVILHEIGDKKNRYQDMIYDGKYYWLLQREKRPIIRWDEENNEVQEYGTFMREMDDIPQRLPFNFIRERNGTLHLYPWMARNGITLDANNGMLISVESGEGLHYFVSEYCDAKTELIIKNGKSVLRLREGERSCEIELNPKELNKDLDISLMKPQGYLYHDSYFPIEVLFSSGNMSVEYDESVQNKAIQSGEKIYRNTVGNGMLFDKNL